MSKQSKEWSMERIILVCAIISFVILPAIMIEFAYLGIKIPRIDQQKEVIPNDKSNEENSNGNEIYNDTK